MWLPTFRLAEGILMFNLVAERCVCKVSLSGLGT